MAEPTGQFSLALDDDALVWAPTWTNLAQDYPNLVTSYTIDRGRQYELDHTDVGRAVVSIADVDGVLDPTNTGGPFHGLIEPLRQAAIARWDPVTDAWFTRYRGFVENYAYDFDRSQRVNRLTVSLVSVQAILSAIEMVPGAFGIDTSGTDSAGQIGFGIQTMKQRIEGVLLNAAVPDDYAVVFDALTELHATVYSPGETVMTVVQEAVDADFPVANSYDDRLGRLAVHGRLARFDPVTTWEDNFYDAWSSSTAYVAGDKVMSGGLAYQCILANTNHVPPNDTYWTEINLKWDFGQWDVGDGAYVAGAPGSRAHLRSFGMERGLAKVMNSALATPVFIADTDVAGQLVQDTGSIGQYGYRSWSAQNLLTRRDLTDDADDLTATRRHATYIVGNYAVAKNRITTISFRSMRPTDSRAAPNWELLSRVDIGDLVNVTVGSPGGGGLDAEPHFVEGVHERVQPLNANYDDVELSLDLSPTTLYSANPYPVPG